MVVRIVARERRVIELARIVLTKVRTRVFFFLMLTLTLLNTGAIGGLRKALLVGFGGVVVVIEVGINN